ncbi:MAG: hypothetical protein CMJ75_06180 [Planctomycetaceae bacterium]|nr:hypothetical protein [Planctomycetaceae bacterium]
MRRIGIVCVAIFLGGAGGWWSASNRLAVVERHVLAPADDVLRSPETSVVAPPDLEEVIGLDQVPSAEDPKIEFVNGSEHQFGTMERFGRKRHVFIIRNAGKGPLVLTPRGTTCKCTVFQVNPPKVAPGEQARVTLEWVAETQEEETNFRQEATVETNVPGQTFIKLVIDGKVTSSLKAVPVSVSLGDVAVGEGAQATVQLFAFRQPGLEVSRVSFADQESASYFDIKIDPLTKDAIDAQAADHGLKVQIVVKPGLPLGKLSQQILLEMPLGDKPIFQIPVTGTVVGDIAILGPKQFDSEENRLVVGRVRSAEGAKITLQVLVKGPHKAQTQLNVQRIDPPDVLRATIGESKETRKGGPLLFPLNLEIPTNSPSVNHLDGDQTNPVRVVIDTTHPHAKRIQLLVEFVVE